MKYAFVIFMIYLSITSSSYAQCTIPESYENQATVVENSIWIGFATDKATYCMSDTVYFYLIVRNDGTETFHENWGIDPQNGVIVLPEGYTDITDPSVNCGELFGYPSVEYYYSDGTTLEPGECEIWDDVSMVIAECALITPGTYNVVGGMRKSAYFSNYEYPCGEFVVPIGGVVVPITIVANPVDLGGASWGEIKARFTK